MKKQPTRYEQNIRQSEVESKKPRFDESEGFGAGEDERRKSPEKRHFPLLSLAIKASAGTLRTGGIIDISVTNHGNAVAHTPFIELMETLESYVGDPAIPGILAASPELEKLMFSRKGFKNLPPIYPHQTINDTVEWVREEMFVQTFFNIVGICYDPLLDPKPRAPYDPVGQPDFHRKIVVQRI